jgi:hypothetical protein
MANEIVRIKYDEIYAKIKDLNKKLKSSKDPIV